MRQVRTSAQPETGSKGGATGTGLKIEYVGIIAVACFVIGVFVGSAFLGDGQKTGMPTGAPGGMTATSPASVSAQDLVAMGNQAYDAGDAKAAIRAYERALQMEPHNADVLTDLGTMYLHTGQVDVAISRFQQAVAIAPNHANSRYNLGIALMQKKDYDKAGQAFRDSIRIAPSGDMAKQARTHLATIEKAKSKR